MESRSKLSPRLTPQPLRSHKEQNVTKLTCLYGYAHMSRWDSGVLLHWPNTQVLADKFPQVPHFLVVHLEF